MLSYVLLQAEQLLKRNTGNDALLVLIWNKIGDHYADRHRWHKVQPDTFRLTCIYRYTDALRQKHRCNPAEAHMHVAAIHQEHHTVNSRRKDT